MTQPPARLLVVDDERNIRKNLHMLLEAAGPTALWHVRWKR